MVDKKAYDQVEYFLDDLSTIASDVSSICTEPTECTLVINPLYSAYSTSIKRRASSMTSVSTIETDENEMDTHSRNVSIETYNYGLKYLYSEDKSSTTNMLHGNFCNESKCTNKEKTEQKIENRYK